MEEKNPKYEYVEGKGRILKEELNQNGFECGHCRKWVSLADSVGTQNRNHCPFCLWSRHVDLEKSGDRESDCEGLMEPIGLTFKQEGLDKWGKEKRGEIMLVHKCSKCDQISINRIAGDDDADEIVNVFEKSLDIEKDEVERLKKESIYLLEEVDGDEIKNQLFGNNLKKR